MRQPASTFASFPIQHIGFKDRHCNLSLTYLHLFCLQEALVGTHKTEAINLGGKARVWNRDNCIFITVAGINWPGLEKLLGNSVSIESNGIPNLLWTTVTLIILCSLGRLSPLCQQQGDQPKLQVATTASKTQANS